MLRRVALVRTDVAEETSVSFIRVTRIRELGTTLAATSNRRATRRNIPEDTIFHSHRREKLKFYILISDLHFGWDATKSNSIEAIYWPIAAALDNR
jgi:hypothetical protein